MAGPQRQLKAASILECSALEDKLGTFEKFARLYKYGSFYEARELVHADTWLPELRARFSIDAEYASLLLSQGIYDDLKTFVAQKSYQYNGMEKCVFEMLHALADAQLASMDIREDSRQAALEEAMTTAVQTLDGFSELSALQTHDEVQNQLIVAFLRIAGLLAKSGMSIPRAVKRPPLRLSTVDPVYRRVFTQHQDWVFYDKLTERLLAKAQFGTACELLEQLFHLDSALAQKNYQRFIKASNLYATQIDMVFSKSADSGLSHGHLDAMEPVLLEVAYASNNMCSFLNFHCPSGLDRLSKALHLRRTRLVVNDFREALGQLHLLNPQVIRSRPYLSFKLREHECEYLEGHPSHPLRADELIESATAQGDRSLVREIKQCQRNPAVSIEPFSPQQTLQGLRSESFSSLRHIFRIPKVPSWSMSLRGPFDEFYPTFVSARDIFCQIVLAIFQIGIGFGLIPIVVLFPGYFTVLYLLGAFFTVRSFGKILAMEQRLVSWESSEVRLERWIFIPDALSTRSMIQKEVDLLSRIFHVDILSIPRGQYGILMNLVDWWVHRRLQILAAQSELGYDEVSKCCKDPRMTKVVVVAHGTGAIAASQALDRMYVTLTQSDLAKLEVYTFASQAQVFHNPRLLAYQSRVTSEVKERPIIAHMEHFYNGRSPLFRTGREKASKAFESPWEGMTFIIDDASGHFLNRNYLCRLFAGDPTGQPDHLIPVQDINAISSDQDTVAHERDSGTARSEKRPAEEDTSTENAGRQTYFLSKNHPGKTPGSGSASVESRELGWVKVSRLAQYAKERHPSL